MTPFECIKQLEAISPEFAAAMVREAERRRPGRADGYWTGAETLREVARDFLRAVEASGYRVRRIEE